MSTKITLELLPEEAEMLQEALYQVEGNLDSGLDGSILYGVQEKLREACTAFVEAPPPVSKRVTMRAIEAYLAVRDEDGEVVAGYSSYRVSMTCPDDWDDRKVREELDEIAVEVDRIMVSS